MVYADASLLVPFLKLLRVSWHSEVTVPFVYRDKVVMGVVDPGGGELGFSIIQIISVCLKSLNSSLVRARRSSAQSSKMPPFLYPSRM